MTVLRSHMGLLMTADQRRRLNRLLPRLATGYGLYAQTDDEGRREIVLELPDGDLVLVARIAPDGKAHKGGAKIDAPARTWVRRRLQDAHAARQRKIERASHA